MTLQEGEKLAGSLKHFLQNNQDSRETIDIGATKSQDSKPVVSVTMSGPSEISNIYLPSKKKIIQNALRGAKILFAHMRQ